MPHFWEHCRNCDHWLEYDIDDEGDKIGMCRRYPPVITEDEFYPTQPTMAEHENCAEFTRDLKERAKLNASMPMVGDNSYKLGKDAT